MYCPECGAEAGDANFCSDCGAELSAFQSTPSCPECGSEVLDDAKFCPECGNALRGARGGSAPRSTGTRGRRPGQGQGQRRPQARREPAPAPSTSKGLSPVMIWAGFGVVAVVIVLIIFIAAGGPGGASDASTTSGSQAAQPVSGDTSGSYGEIVQRANGLYDQGAQAFDSKQYAQGTNYFQAASKVYAAAWKQQSTDPNVGTDYATSLFYSGRIDAALTQVERVLAKSPDFQTAWFNKGNYLSERARSAKESGDGKTARTDYAEARAAYEKAIAIDRASEVGTQAKERLSQLPA